LHTNISCNEEVIGCVLALEQNLHRVIFLFKGTQLLKQKVVVTAIDDMKEKQKLWNSEYRKGVHWEEGHSKGAEEFAGMLKTGS
jgi:hypothetical protein